MYVGACGRLDTDKLSPIVDYSYKVIDDMGIHKSGVHKTIPICDPQFDSFWSENQDLKKYLECMTHPFDEPIYNMWVKYYSCDYKVPGSNGGFFGLHQDYTYERPRDKDYQIIDKSLDEKHLMFSNSVIIDVSDDIEGGEIVLAGDSSGTGKVSQRLIDSRDIMHRLKVIKANKPGDHTVWNGYTMHGVAELSKGWRMSLLVIKKVPYNEDYFKCS
jgi:hypothetical protein